MRGGPPLPEGASRAASAWNCAVDRVRKCPWATATIEARYAKSSGSTRKGAKLKTAMHSTAKAPRARNISPRSRPAGAEGLVTSLTRASASTRTILGGKAQDAARIACELSVNIRRASPLPAFQRAVSERCRRCRGWPAATCGSAAGIPPSLPPRATRLRPLGRFRRRLRRRPVTDPADQQIAAIGSRGKESQACAAVVLTPDCHAQAPAEDRICWTCRHQAR